MLSPFICKAKPGGRAGDLSLTEIYDLAESGLTEVDNAQRTEFLQLIELERILEREISPY